MRSLAAPRATPRPDHSALAFWLVVACAELLVLPVALRSPLLGAAFAFAVGLLAILSTFLGSRRGTVFIGAALLLMVIVTPGNIALTYRIPVGGGGIFMSDLVLAVLLASAAAVILGEGRLTIVASPVSVPALLFLVWIAAAGVIGFMYGNDLKLILQDGRNLAYYVLVFFPLLFLNDRRRVLLFLRLLAVALVLTFLIGAVYAARGKGMVLEFVEPGVSRFPAPDEVFLMGSILTATFIVVWPASRPRPWWLWGLLFVALLGLILSLVRGNWVAFAASLVYLFAIVQLRERLRLVAGVVVLAAVLGAGLAVARPALLTSVLTRASAVTAVQDPNVQYRLIEIQDVTPQIKAHLLFGNGLGKSYVFDFSRFGVKPIVKSYIHNNYYWFVHRLGVFGLGLFLWLMAAFLWPWMRYRRSLPRDDPWLTGLVYGGRALAVALLVVSITSPRLNTKVGVSVLAIVMGLSEVALQMLRQPAAGAAEEPEPQAGEGREARTVERAANAAPGAVAAGGDAGGAADL
jgi:hypothetical protein